MTPVSVGVNPETNAIYVANLFSNTVSVIKGVTHKVTATITVGANPVGIAVDLSTNTIFFANSYGTISVVDGATNKAMATIGEGSLPWALLRHESGHDHIRLLVADDGTPSIQLIDAVGDLVWNAP